MATWKVRFEGLIYEENGLETPNTIRQRELNCLVMSHFADLYQTVEEQAYQTESLIFTQEMWEQLVNDPLFCDTKKERTEWFKYEE